ncbi:hypothetical protein KEM54_006255 [Ascosphaera aggregata]|nr:hypothetical protein KEM54_006255 [Ascosphaera aggregata]
MSGLTALFQTSWTAHRLSPLFNFGEDDAVISDQNALDSLARRLRLHLRGDPFREIYTGLGNTVFGNDTVAKAGALKSCQWQSLPPWKTENGHGNDDPRPMGIMIIMEYDNVIYKAALLGGLKGSSDIPKGSVNLPLLLTRLPNILRQALVSFLCETFDTYCTILRFPSSFLCRASGTYLSTLKAVGEGLIEKIMRDMQLTISFPSPIAPSLRSIQIYLPRTTVRELSPESSSEISASDSQISTLHALSAYLDKHLAMKLDFLSSEPNRERITKVSCGAFILGSEGRVKLLTESTADDSDELAREEQAIEAANEELLTALVKRALGTKIMPDGQT